MALILAVDCNSLPDWYVKEQLDQIGEYWADLIITAIKDGKKPEILIDRSGSMSMEAGHGSGITRMDLALAVIESLAQKLPENSEDFKVDSKLYDSIPVKSWGSGVYEEHFVSPKTKGWAEEQPPLRRKKTTLRDFRQNAIIPSQLPKIPCTDGTDHSLWFNESEFPLVITDDYGYQLNNELLENYRNFDWCEGNNILAIDSHGQELRLERMNKTLRNAAMGYDAINQRDF